MLRNRCCTGDTVAAVPSMTTSKDFRPEAVITVVVYAREGGLTGADRSRIARDARQLRTVRARGTGCADAGSGLRALTWDGNSLASALTA